MRVASPHTLVRGQKTYLLIEFNEDWLIELLVVFAPVVNILGVAETLVELSLVRHEVSFDWSGERVLRNGNIFGISNLL